MDVQYGVRLQLLRNRMGFTQAEAAKKSKIKLSKLVDLELGKGNLSADQAYRLAYTYYCDIDDVTRDN